MAVRSSTFQIAMIVLIIVGILIVIHSSWTLSQLRRIVGDTCDCSGVTDHELRHTRGFAILMLLIGIAVIIYAVVLLVIPTAEKREHYRSQLSERRNSIRERFSDRSD